MQSKLRTAQVEISQRCNQRCIFCGPSTEQDSALLRASTVQNWSTELQHCTHLSIAGFGEPTLNHDVILKILAKVPNVLTELFSNGTASSLQYKEYFSAGLSILWLSVHGLPAQHDYATSSSFGEHIHQLISTLTQTHVICTNTVTVSSFFQSAPEFLKTLENMGVSRIRLSFPELSGRMLKHFHEVPTASQFRVLSEKLSRSSTPVEFKGVPKCWLHESAKTAEEHSEPATQIFSGSSRGESVSLALGRGHNTFVTQCEQCALRAECPGVSKELLARGAVTLWPSRQSEPVYIHHHFRLF